MADPVKEDQHSLPPPPPYSQPRRSSVLGTTRQKDAIRKKFGRSVVIDSRNNLYDLDGDGKLDAIEQSMMKYDKDGDGKFSNAEIYDIIHEQLMAERKAGKMKNMIMGMSCFLSLLALSNLGTSFAALFLSKELVADNDAAVMRLQGSGMLASVQSATETLDLMPLSNDEYEQRKLLVLRDLEEDPHSHAHRRLKKSKKSSGCKGVLCDGDIMFDNGKIKEKDFRMIEQKCKQLKNVKIRRAKEFDRQADSICNSGTSIVVKQKKGNNKNKKKSTDREVLIVSSSNKKMNVDCVGDNCYVSGDLLLGRFGESCDRNRNDCEAHLICDSGSNKNPSAAFGTCIYPRFVKTGGLCDLGYMEEACDNLSYCWSDSHKVTRGTGKGDNTIVNGPSGNIKIGNSSKNIRFALGTRIGECLRQVGVGSLCSSPLACIEGYTCIGPGGIAIGLDPYSSGSVNGPSGSVRWGIDMSNGICM